MRIVRIIMLTAALAVVGWVTTVSAQETLIVNDVPGEAGGATATEARTIAIAKAQREALKRLAAEQNMPAEQIAAMSDDAIGALVTGFEVEAEKIAAKHYKAKFNISFNARQLQQLFGGAPIAASTVQAPPVSRQTLLVPVLTIDGQLYLWEEPNPWREAWMRMQSSGQSRDILMPLGDLNDLSTVDRKAIVNRDRMALTQLALRYGVDTVTLAEAELINQTDSVLLRGTLTQISGDRAMPPPLSFSVRGKALDTALFNGGVQDALQQLTGVRPDLAALATTPEEAAAAGHTEMKLLIPLQNSSDWVKIRQMFQGLPNVSNIRVIAITPNQADVSLRYGGTAEELTQTLQPKGYALTPYPGYWVMHLPGQG